MNTATTPQIEVQPRFKCGKCLNDFPKDQILPPGICRRCDRGEWAADSQRQRDNRF